MGWWILMLIMAIPLAFLAGKLFAEDYLGKLSDRTVDVSRPLVTPPKPSSQGNMTHRYLNACRVGRIDPNLETLTHLAECDVRGTTPEIHESMKMVDDFRTKQAEERATRDMLTWSDGILPGPIFLNTNREDDGQ